VENFNQFKTFEVMKKFTEQKKWKCRRKRGRVCWVMVSSALLYGGAAIGQTNSGGNIILSPLAPVAPTPAAPANVSTNAVISGESTNVANLGNVTVVGRLNQARSRILTEVGATAYTHTAENIQAQSQGENAPLNQVILRSPGVAEDSAENGDLHVRGEHANLQYRINGVLLPEGITGGFGLELDPRFIESMQLIDGSLPAEYGFRTAGVIDIQTKTGAFENGGDVDVYGGSYNTFRPSFEYGDTEGKWDYFTDGSFDENDLGVENPTSSHNAIHDHTDQYKGFIYASRLLSDTSRLTLMGSASYTTYQIPDTAGLSPGMAPDGASFWYQYMTNSTPNTNSADLNENQVEQNYYGVAAYQQSVGNLNYQLAGYGRMSGVHFLPDPNGDLVFDGEASDVARRLYSGGLQLDASYELGDKHTIRFGGMVLDEYLSDNTSTTVFDVNGSGTPTSGPFAIAQNSVAHALYAGVYAQDEWKILPKVTLNYGARFDQYYATFDKENQPSPRVNLVYQPTDSTTMHIGYSRYFTPPPLENVPSGNLAPFSGTSGATAVTTDGTVRAERANYYDAGISQKITKHFQVGVDGYYKTARNQIDDGLFGQTLILSAFNYDRGRVYGIEGTSSFNWGGFSAYANLAWSQAYGKDWASAQFLFSPNDIAYVQNHWIYLDHDQRLSGNFGVSYTLTESPKYSSLFYADAIYGSGLRQSGGGFEPNDPTAPIPNGASVPQYYSINIGAEQDFKIPHNRMLKARIDVVNLTDNTYELRSGSGVGVNAAQYGERRGFFGSLTLVF
jgi:outer membrane receptor protein involved in Fe transport